MTASETAWPFLIGRTKDEDYRLVVIPGFMASQSSAAALRASTGGEPGAVRVREFRLSPGELVTAIYRVRRAVAAEYGIPGDGPLTDSHGRAILLTEGLVMRGDSASAMTPGAPEEALDLVPALVAPAFKEFWEQGNGFKRRSSQAIAIPSGDQSQQTGSARASGASPGLLPVPARPATATPRQRHRHYAFTAYVFVSIGLVAVVAALVLLAGSLLASGNKRPVPAPTSTSKSPASSSSRPSATPSPHRTRMKSSPSPTHATPLPSPTTRSSRRGSSPSAPAHRVRK